MINTPENDSPDDTDIPDVGPEDRKKNLKLRKDAKAAERNPEQSRVALRRKVRIFYDLQRLRMQTAGRGAKKGPDAEVELHEVDIAILDNRAGDLSRAEKNALADIEAHLHTLPAYTKILADKTRFKGIGPTLAGVILSEVDIRKAHTVSALWRYAGLAPVSGRRCKYCNDSVIPGPEIAEGMVAAYKHEFNRKEKCKVPTPNFHETYDSGKAERGVKGEKLHYNSFLKTKMVGVMSGCLLKSGSPFRKFYDDYKLRLVSGNKGRDDGHRHQMALRYMVKMVLAEIWRDWRALEGLEIRPSYHEQYLGHTHHEATG